MRVETSAMNRIDLVVTSSITNGKGPVLKSIIDSAPNQVKKLKVQNLHQNWIDQVERWQQLLRELRYLIGIMQMVKIGQRKPSILMQNDLS